jgi:hypothetical protein
MPDENDVSRRSFLKMLGLGSLSLGALSFMPSVASKVTIGPDEISMDNNPFLSSTSDTSISGEIKNFVLDKRSSPPEEPKVGQMWYDTTADN